MTTDTRTPDQPARTAGTHRARRTLAERIWRHIVLAIPLVLVNLAAVYGQVQWATANLTAGNLALAAVFAGTVESIAVYLAYEAHAALLAGDASLRLRVASYAVAGLVGALNYSHFAGPGFRPTAVALAFGGLSCISPWLWSIRSRSMRRDQLREAGLIDPRSARFAAVKWVLFPVRSWRAFRWAVDHGVQSERAAWEGRRVASTRNGSTSSPAQPAGPIDLDGLPEYPSKRDYVRHAFTALGSDDVPAALQWLADRGVKVARGEAYAVRRAERARETAPPLAVVPNGKPS